MKYWLLADPHLGHDLLVTEGLRSEGFEELIFKSIRNLVLPGDVLIVLGDFCKGQDEYWHKQFFTKACNDNVKVILILGNHDNKTNSWYLNHGWDFVMDSILMKIHGLEIVFSHHPVMCGRSIINIHGHLHKDRHRNNPTNKNNILIYTEDVYAPVDLRDVLEGKTEYCGNLVRTKK